MQSNLALRNPVQVGHIFKGMNVQVRQGQDIGGAINRSHIWNLTAPFRGVELMSDNPVGFRDHDRDCGKKNQRGKGGVSVTVHDILQDNGLTIEEATHVPHIVGLLPHVSEDGAHHIVRGLHQEDTARVFRHMPTTEKRNAFAFRLLDNHRTADLFRHLVDHEIKSWISSVKNGHYLTKVLWAAAHGGTETTQILYRAVPEFSDILKAATEQPVRKDAFHPDFLDDQ